LEIESLSHLEIYIYIDTIANVNITHLVCIAWRQVVEKKLNGVVFKNSIIEKVSLSKKEPSKNRARKPN
jgi:hypothetical protein